MTSFRACDQLTSGRNAQGPFDPVERLGFDHGRMGSESDIQSAWPEITTNVLAIKAVANAPDMQAT